MIPPLLYKYCSPSGIDILRNLRLKVTPPNQFNDPFELAPRMEEALSREKALEALSEPRILRKTYEDMIKSGDFIGTDQEFLAVVGQYSEHFSQGLIASYPASAVEFRKNHINNISAEFGLICLSEVENDILMWSHYTRSHTGLVIGFHTSHPFFSNPPLLQVNYKEERVLMGQSVKQEDSLRAEQVNALIRRKSPHWSYEREWRQLHFLQRCTNETDSRTDCVHYFSSFDPALIAKVIIGCRCTNEAEIRNLLSEPKFSHVEVFTYEMHESEFALVASK